MKSNIKIIDFDLFYSTVKTANNMVESAKFIVDSTGLKIYGKNTVARCEIESNSIVSNDELSFCIKDIKAFIKILTTIKDIQAGDFLDFKFLVDGNILKFSSKKFKSKLSTCQEDIIIDCISQKLHTELTPIFEFISSHTFMKRVASHSFIISEPADLRIYLQKDKDLENNTLYATVGNKSNDLNNAITLKFGAITSGDLKDRELILDLERLHVFDMIQGEDVKIQLMDKNCLVSKSTTTGKNNTWLNITIINSLRMR